MVTPAAVNVNSMEPGTWNLWHSLQLSNCTDIALLPQSIAVSLPELEITHHISHTCQAALGSPLCLYINTRSDVYFNLICKLAFSLEW